MNYKAIIFDMDGTIIDTELIWHEANKALFAKRGITFTTEIEQELMQRLSGTGLSECCKIIKEIAKFDDDLSVLIEENAVYADNLYKTNVKFIEGFLDFHALALSMNLQVGLATNATNQTIKITNEKLDLEKLFGKHIYNISHVNNQYKPHPAVYLHAARQLQLDPAECIAIEDSINGIKSAVQAGMFCIGINTSRLPKELMTSHLIINQYKEINLKKLLY